MNNTITLRKSRELGEVLGDSFTFLKENLKYIYKPVLIIGGTYSFLYAVFLYTGFIQINPNYIQEQAGNTAAMPAYFLGIFFGSFLILIGMLCNYLILINLISFKAKNPEMIPSTSDLFKDLPGQFFKVILNFIPIIFIEALLLVALIIPGIWFSIIIAIFVPTLLFEKGSFGQLLSRARFLVKNNWWNTALAYWVPSICVVIVQFPVTGAFMFYLLTKVFHGDFNSIPPGVAIYYFFALLLSSFLYLWPSTCIALQYLNLVHRKDNLDFVASINDLGIESNDSENSGITDREEY